MAVINNAISDTIISATIDATISTDDNNNINNVGNNVTIYGYDNYDYGDYINNNGSNVVIYTGKGNDRVTNYGKNTTIYSGDGNDTITTYGESTRISLGTGSNSVKAFAEGVIIELSMGNQTIQSGAGTGTSIQGDVSNDNITVQKNGTGTGVVATVNGGRGDDTFTGSSGAEVFVYASNDGNDVIFSWSSDDTIVLTSGSVSDSATNVSGDVIIGVGYDSITIKDAKTSKINIVSDGALISTVPSVETAVTLDSSFTSYDVYPNTIKKIDASKVTSAIEIYGNDNDNTITGSSKADTIYGGIGKDVIRGGAGNDNIYGDKGADSLFGGNGADTLDGGMGADTLTGGAGNDVFVYASGDGKDVITDYTSNQDKIKITGNAISGTSVSGSDVILTVGSGSIRIKDGKEKTLSIFNNSNTIMTTVIGGSTKTATTLKSGLSYSADNSTLTATTPFTGTIDLKDYASTVTIVNASTNTKFVNIKGTARAETLRAGSGGSILNGGGGNDKLYGNSGADTFVYANGDGNDTIYKYTPYLDTIKITSGTISNASISGSNVVLTVGTGSITINNGQGKDINITDSSGETKTYNFTTTVSNPTASSYMERWFSEDYNFIGNNSQLDTMVKADDSSYSVGNVETTDTLTNLIKDDHTFIKAAYNNKD